MSWGTETARKFTKDELEALLTTLDEGGCGTVLRAKGVVDGRDTWYEFDMVPGEWEVRPCSPAVTGKLVVIGAQLDTAAVAKLIG